MDEPYEYAPRTFVAGDKSCLRRRVGRRLVRDEHPAAGGDDGRQVSAGAAKAGEQLGAMPVPVAYLEVVLVAALCNDKSLKGSFQI